MHNKFLNLCDVDVNICVGWTIEVTCWIVTGERQAAKIRGLYLKTILRQDIAFFDTETTTGEVISRMSGDTVLIQDAMGEKVGKFTQLTATFVGGIAIAFIKGWLLALVLMVCIPAIVIAGATMALLMMKMSSRAQMAYAEAGNVVEQTVSAIRTVSFFLRYMQFLPSSFLCVLLTNHIFPNYLSFMYMIQVASFTGEKDAIEKYDSKLIIAYKAAAKQGLASGLGLGALVFVIMSTYALAVWYGAKLIMEKSYNGGEVLNVIMAMMTGGMQVFPPLFFL